ncbi:hypothetical protein MVEG_00195 [Podila verticillata NRRL 6337]|nr:hypothetical protein MVEG_00195 [Podila verticillata NRRL 6337]
MAPSTRQSVTEGKRRVSFQGGVSTSSSPLSPRQHPYSRPVVWAASDELEDRRVSAVSSPPGSFSDAAGSEGDGSDVDRSLYRSPSPSRSRTSSSSPAPTQHLPGVRPASTDSLPGTVPPATTTPLLASTPLVTSTGFGVPLAQHPVFPFGVGASSEFRVSSQTILPGVFTATSTSSPVIPRTAGISSSSISVPSASPAAGPLLMSAEALRREAATHYLRHIDQHLRHAEENTRILGLTGISAEERQWRQALQADLWQRDQDVRTFIVTLVDDPETQHLRRLVQNVSDLIQLVARRQ